MNRAGLSPVSLALLHAGHIPDQDILELEGMLRREEVERNTMLLQFGQVALRMYFIEKGLARAYYLHEGKDVSDYFAMDMQFIGAVPSLFTGQPTHKAIEVLEDSIVWSMGKEDWERLCEKSHPMERIYRKQMAMGMLIEQQRIESIRFHTAAERYAELERSHPGISLRCPLKHIASFLGITQVSLSRIRAGVQ